jgi:hypothetical protein
MKPAGKPPRTAPPMIAIDGSTVSLSHPTEESAIIDRVGFGDPWCDWKRNRKSFPIDRDSPRKYEQTGPLVESLASRLGFTGSEIIVAQQRFPYRLPDRYGLTHLEM